MLFEKQTDIVAGMALAEDLMMLKGLNAEASTRISELANKVHGEEGFELNEEEINELKTLVSNLYNMPLFVKISICNYLENVVNE